MRKLRSVSSSSTASEVGLLLIVSVFDNLELFFVDLWMFVVLALLDKLSLLIEAFWETREGLFFSAGSSSLLSSASVYSLY